ncbi:MAG: alpha-glucan family phosphorylase [Planctomycetes bacterium]|nr:alpha-glucan family phosphorylase [Planctomycetota bacterium]
MEVALDGGLPTYAGGLGVLAGDTLRTAADLGLPMVGVTLLHRKGYFFQRIDADGRQIEEPAAWNPESLLHATPGACTVEIEGRKVALRAWEHRIVGASGSVVPAYFLDADLPQNAPDDRRLTDHLYGGDERYRLCQEVILGIGGARMLRALGYTRVVRHHMNEGHSALLALELLAEELARGDGGREEAVERVRRRCVFTTHTPVPAAFDQFSLETARGILGDGPLQVLETLGCCPGNLNPTRVALSLSHWVNGVTKRHGEVSASMFPGYPVASITNGVHSATWTCPSFRALYDRTIPDWRRDSFALRYAFGLRPQEVREAHEEAKARLVREVDERTNAGFDRNAFTIGSARRAAAYKRPALLLRDPERLRDLARRHGPIQIVFAGKAHPRDEAGKEEIRAISRAAAALRPDVRVAFLPNYDLDLAALMTAGVDLWVNTPRPPHEASGTSGMKAAHNGVPSLSVLDGWWHEGHIEGVTGWAIGSAAPGPAGERADEEDAADLYRVLDEKVLPLYHGDPPGWVQVMRLTIALNASFFNAQRMLQQYVVYAYSLRESAQGDRGPRGPAAP